jgi:tripartite-type tricarboxylate transporter receptor subunit TctC
MKKFLALVLSAVAMAAMGADAYPSRAITLIVPFAAGGPTDRVARDLAEALRKPLGRNHCG